MPCTPSELGINEPREDDQVDVADVPASSVRPPGKSQPAEEQHGHYTDGAALPSERPKDLMHELEGFNSILKEFSKLYRPSEGKVLGNDPFWPMATIILKLAKRAAKESASDVRQLAALTLQAFMDLDPQHWLLSDSRQFQHNLEMLRGPPR